MAQTTSFTRRHLPHWEVEQGRYFVTVRCADSLPQEVILRWREISDNLRLIAPQSDQFHALQHQSFQTLEKYLDAGAGSCPLRHTDAARLVLDEFASLADWQVTVPHCTIMPNHWHALLEPDRGCARSLSAIMKRIKGRTAKRLRASMGGHGPVWQREWFDRWMRNDAEWEKCVAYIRNNPVKAGLVAVWSEHPWTR